MLGRTSRRGGEAGPGRLGVTSIPRDASVAAARRARDPQRGVGGPRPARPAGGACASPYRRRRPAVAPTVRARGPGTTAGRSRHVAHVPRGGRTSAVGRGAVRRRDGALARRIPPTPSGRSGRAGSHVRCRYYPDRTWRRRWGRGVAASGARHARRTDGGCHLPHVVRGSVRWMGPPCRRLVGPVPFSEHACSVNDAPQTRTDTDQNDADQNADQIEVAR